MAGLFGTVQVWAAPLPFGPWREFPRAIFPQPISKEDQVLTFRSRTASQAPSTCDVEIRVAVKLIRDVGPGTHQVRIGYNDGGTARARARSHTLGQNVFIEG